MIRSSRSKKRVSRWAKTTISLGTGLVALGSVRAQNPGSPTGETTTPDRIIVTGSNIPTAEEVGAAPVTTLDQAAIGRTGVDDAQVVLQKSDPSFTGGGNLGQNNASVGSGATNGGSSVSIRGLPTLVLLNGRRIADSAALATGGLQFQDVNLFPAALIKRIEVLKDGASAIYGSDAVGGVVNVLLNDDFQGVALSGRFGFAQKGDIQDQRYSGVAGFGDEHTRIVVAAQYEEQDPIFTNQRTWAQIQYNPEVGYTTTSTNFGGKISIAGSTRTLLTGLGSAFGSGPATVIVPGDVPTNVSSPSAVVGVGGLTPVFSTGNALVPAGTQLFSVNQFPTGVYGTSGRNLDLNNYTGVTLDQNRTNAYGSIERDIIDKKLVVFGDFIFTKNYSQSYLAPQPVATNSSLNVEQNMIIPIGSPYNPFNSTIGAAQGAIATVGAGATQTAAGTPLLSATTGLPVGAGNLVVTNRFLSDPRVFRNDTQFYRFVAGLKGEIIKDYNYEVAFNHSEDEINFKNFNLVRSDLVNEAIAGGYNADGTLAPAVLANNVTVANAAGVGGGVPYQTVVTPAGAYSRINGAIYPALNPFALNNPVSTEQAILGTDVRDQQSKLTVIDGKLTGFPVNLPGGPLGFAIGGEYRREELRENGSVENFVASVPVSDVEVGRDIEAAYLEVSLPVVAPNMKIPVVYSFDVDAAVRYEHYEGTGDNVVPKVSFVYRPIVDVALRGTYSKAFRAPNLIETNGPASAGFTALTNLGAGFSEQANVVTASNPALGPERSDTWDGGIVISPHQVPGLTITGDFFHVEERNIISSIPTGTILTDANTLGSASPFNGLIHFGSINGPNLTSTAPGQIQGNASSYFIFSQPFNQTNFRESGVDFNINYDHDFGAFGGVTVGMNGLYYLQNKNNETAGGKNFDNIGLYLGGLSGLGGSFVPQYKLAPYVSYRFGGASFSALANYIPSLRDAAFLNDQTDRAGSYTQYGGGNLAKIRDYYTIDLTASYEFGLNKKTPGAVTPAPKDAKDGKGGGGKEMVATPQTAKQMMGIKLLDGLKFTFGINNVTNARPPFVYVSPDSDNTDAAIYDPYQRYFYFVLSKKF